MPSWAHRRHNPLSYAPHLRPSEEVKGKLPQQGIHGILDQTCELGSISVMVKMADAEVLFNYVPDSGDDHVPFFLRGGQLRTLSGLSHSAVLDLVREQKLTVLLFPIALVGKDLLDRIEGMTAAGDPKWEELAVIEGGRGDVPRTNT
jgi:hypothetical protein